MLIYQSLAAGHHWLLAGFGLGVLFGAPWLAAAAWLWRRSPDNGVVPPSLGETALRRLGL